MKRIVRVLYRFDDNDSVVYAKQVEEAFNRMANFAPEIFDFKGKKEERPAVLRSFNVVTATSNAEFDRTDVNILRDYALKVVKRAKQRIANKTVMPEMAESVQQAACHLEIVLNNLAMALDEADEQERWQ